MLSAHWLTVLVSTPEAITCPKKVVLPRSGATKSGFWRMTGVASRLPDLSNRIGSPPTEE